MARSGGKCELSGREGELLVYKVSPENAPENELLIERKLIEQIENRQELSGENWRFLTDSMWSEVPAVQVLSWRLLNRLRNEAWAAEALEILYLDDETLEWAKAGAELAEEEPEEELVVHRDAFGNILQNGDSVVVTKTLDVKGSSISAKQGTIVRNIRLVPDNAEQIEGRVGGQMIVILTRFLRKN